MASDKYFAYVKTYVLRYYIFQFVYFNAKDHATGNGLASSEKKWSSLGKRKRQEDGEGGESNSDADIPTLLAFCQLHGHPSCTRVPHYRPLTAAASRAAISRSVYGPRFRPAPGYLSHTEAKKLSVVGNPRNTDLSRQSGVSFAPVKVGFDLFAPISPVTRRQQESIKNATTTPPLFPVLFQRNKTAPSRNGDWRRHLVFTEITETWNGRHSVCKSYRRHVGGILYML